MTSPSITQIDALLSVRDVAQVFGLTPNSIHVALHRGRFPLRPFRVGNRLRWRASDVHAWIAREAEAANADGADAPARG